MLTMRIEHSMEVDCTPARLWPYLEDPELQKRWMKGLLENKLTSAGPSGEGSTFRMKVKEGFRVAEYDGEITAHDPPRHMGVRLSGGGFKPGMAMNADYRLTDLNGRTRLDYLAWLEAERLGFFMRLMMPLFKVFGTMQLKSFLKTLKREAEKPA